MYDLIELSPLIISVIIGIIALAIVGIILVLFMNYDYEKHNKIQKKNKNYEEFKLK